jgi:hypothetical protein
MFENRENITAIEEHPDYVPHGQDIRGRPLSETDMLGLLEISRIAKTDLRAFWHIIEPDGTRREYGEKVLKKKGL